MLELACSGDEKSRGVEGVVDRESVEEVLLEGEFGLENECDGVGLGGG